MPTLRSRSTTRSEPYAAAIVRDYSSLMSQPFELRKIGHVVLNVTDLAAAVRFYTEMLGLKVSDRYPDTMVPGGMVFMRVSTDHHGVALVGGAKKGDVTSLNHFALEVGSPEQGFRA